MLIKELNEVDASIRRIKKVSKYLSFTFKAIAVIVLIILAVLIIMVGFVDDSSGSPLANILSLLPLWLYGFATVFLFWIMQSFFRDISKGDTPFTRSQAKKLRWSAIILLVGALAELLFSSGATPVTQICGLAFNYYDSALEVSTPSLNLTSIIGAAMLYTLSLVFKYGVLLQEFSDETL